MARDTTEVLIGTGTLYLAPTGTAFPADPSAAPAGTWVDIGYSEEGWSFNIDRTLEDVEVAEEIDPLDVLQTKRELHIVGSCAQASLDNLLIALGSGAIVDAVGPPAIRTYTPGATDSLTRKALLLRTKAPGTDKLRDTRISYVVSASAVEMASKKAPEKTLIAMDFRALKVSGTDLFTIRDLD